MSQISSISQYLHCTPSTHGITRDNHDSSKNMVFIRSQFYCFWFNATFNFIFRMLLAPWECSDVFLTVCFFEFHFASCSQPHLRSRRLPFFSCSSIFLFGWVTDFNFKKLSALYYIHLFTSWKTCHLHSSSCSSYHDTSLFHLFFHYYFYFY